MRKFRRRIGLNAESDRKWLVFAARFGYGACGFIYAAIGLVAIAVALGLGETPTGSHGVMEFLSRQPFAPFLLAALGIGLAGYAALNIAGAISDPERRGVSTRGLVLRAVDIVTGGLYVTLALAALGLVVGSSGNAYTAEAFAQRVMALPFGRPILALIGASLLVGSAYLFLRSVNEEFGEMLDRRELSMAIRTAIAVAARAGTATRAVVFALCGVFSIKSALANSPAKAGDVDDALAAIANATLGPLLLGFMGLGFIAYGLYQLSKARYQRIAVSN